MRRRLGRAPSGSVLSVRFTSRAPARRGVPYEKDDCHSPERAMRVT
jgi:hypothetical protein